MSGLKKAAAVFLAVVLICCTMFSSAAGFSAQESTEATIGATEAVTEPETQPDTQPETQPDTQPETVPDPIPDNHTAPGLSVMIPYQYDWTNTLEDWSVLCSKGADLYFKVSSEDEDDWGSYTDSDAVLWDNGDELPEGSYYIRFWAVYPDPESPVTESDTAHYKYDCTKPSDFTIKESGLKLTAESPITDEASGVDYILYAIDDDSMTTVEEIYEKATVAELEEIDGRNEVNFSIKLKPEYKGKTVTVYVVDAAGNIRSVSTGDETSDTDIPTFEKFGFVNVEKNSKGKTIESDISRKEFDIIGSADKTEYYYLSDSSYIKAVIKEEHLDSVTVSAASDGETFTATIEKDDLKVPEGISEKEDTYYIPIAALGGVIRESGKTNCIIDRITVSAEDSFGHKSEEENNITETELFYDGFVEDEDVVINSELTGKHITPAESERELDEDTDAYFTERAAVEFTFSDDIGLQSYSIKLSYLDENGDKQIISNSENSDLFDIAEEDGNEYTVPLKKLSGENNKNLDLELKNNEADSDDGTYLIDIELKDLAGNTEKASYKYVVDTTAPAVSEFKYIVKPDILRYFTFGIFGSDTVDVMVQVTDGYSGSGFDLDQINLFWDSETPYEAKQDGDWIVFEDLNINSEGKPYIKTSDKLGNESTYYFETVEETDESSPDTKPDPLLTTDEDSGVSLVLENNAPKCLITVSGTGTVDEDRSYRIGLGGGDRKLYFGRSTQDDNLLSFSFTDNYGLSDCYVEITDKDGKSVKNVTKSFIKETEGVKEYEQSINVSDLESGEYTLVITASDLAGNAVMIDSDTPFDAYQSFVVDNDAPVISNSSYTVSNTLLNYLSFGIFGNKDIAVSVNIADAHSMVKEIGLYWDKTSPYLPDYDAASGEYTFSGLKLHTTGQPHITITDMLNNTNNYYFKPASDTDSGKQIGYLIENDPSNGVILMLEDTDPDVSISIPEQYFTVNGEKWYGSGIEYKVAADDSVSDAADIQSGLRNVKVDLTDNEGNTLSSAEETSYDGKAFGSGSVTDPVEYTYSVPQEGHYNVAAQAEDNAGNTKSAYERFSIDINSPKITSFRAGDQTTVEPFYNDFYGYFFDKATELRVYVEDPGVSSQINRVEIYLSSTQNDNQVYHYTTYGSDLSSDDTGAYAFCTIPVGFKGRMYAEVIDNVTHTSGVIDTDGSIVEDSEIHGNISSVEITADSKTDHNDANDVPLYNTSVPLTISVKDTFSGIGKIEWSIADDNESGTVTVDIKGNCVSDSEAAVIDEGSIVRDQNLVTNLNFALTVDSNTNGNVVHIKTTDRAGNISEAETKFSIDTTAPTITAVKSNTNPVNGNYYNTIQTVTVSITERNFDPSAPVVLVNGNAYSVSWDDSSPSVTTDSTVHTGTFTLSDDDHYTFTVSYTDMAGNEGTAFSEAEFIIDRTNPVITNNFADFGTVGDNGIYFNIKAKDKTKAEITVTEVNFLEEDMNLTMYYKVPGSSHSDGGWSNYPMLSSWSTSGNSHSLTIPFTEDGVYKLTMAPVDRASNAGVFSSGSSDRTAVFECDYTAPVVYSRSGNTVDAKNVEFSDVYDYERRNEANPNIVFMDTNIEKIEYSLREYVPTYTKDKEMGTIKPVETSAVIKTYIDNSDTTQMIFTLDDFSKDGVYSADMIAYDKAGNESEPNKNTYLRMVDTKVLAYIENSDSEQKTGWYSFEDENGPISKQPDSFMDLNIVVFSMNKYKTSVCLVDKATNESTDTNITAEPNTVFDDKMFDVGAHRYILPGSYFAEHYTADADTSLYLRVNNGKNSLDLGELYIDNTKPTCTVPEEFKDWGMIGGSGNKTIVFTDVSEILQVTQTVSYVDKETVPIEDFDEETAPNFAYDQAENQLSLTLQPGSHSAGLLLVDRAGNSTSIKEVQHLAIGNYRIWIGVGIGAGVIACGVLAFLLVRYNKRKKLAK